MNRKFCFCCTLFILAAFTSPALTQDSQPKPVVPAATNPSPDDLLLACMQKGRFDCDVPTPKQPGSGTINIPSNENDSGLVWSQKNEWNFDQQLNDLQSRGIILQPQFE
jgi:hypothetical protein